MVELQLHSLNKSFGRKKILDDLKISLKTGEVMGIFGRNGSGKSTLLKILFGTLKAENIHMQINGRRYLGSAGLGKSDIISQQQIGYLPQFSFLPHNSEVRRIIPRFFADTDDQERLFYDPGIARIDGKKINQLSLGERRYLELLLVGNLDHPFLILDEPFSMVEPLYAERITAFILKLKQKKGIILTDHYYESVWKVSTIRWLLKDGKLHSLKSQEQLAEMGYLKRTKNDWK